MPSHTREDIQIIARRKTVGLLAEAKVACKDILNSHEWAVAFANYIEAQSPSDKLALMSLLSTSRTPPLTLPPVSSHPAGCGAGRAIGASET